MPGVVSRVGLTGWRTGRLRCWRWLAGPHACRRRLHPATRSIEGEPDAEGVCPALGEGLPECNVEGCERCAASDPNTCEVCEVSFKYGFNSLVKGACIWTDE